MKESHIRIKKIVLIGLFAAILTGGKLALMSLPNIEVVTLFIFLFSLSFGWKMSLASVLVFCAVEVSIFGFNTWIIAYFIYWPLVALVSSFFFNRYHNNIIIIIIGVFMTFLFGVITSLVDAAFAYGASGINFFTLFFAIYARGVLFYAVHIASNAVLMSIVFPVLHPLFLKAKIAYFNEN
ncbi:MAG: hypothetical protein ACOCWI_02535 [Bacillota bacterium]